jgi:hypothetical protein
MEKEKEELEKKKVEGGRQDQGGLEGEATLAIQILGALT